MTKTPIADSIMKWIWGFNKGETGKEYYERKLKEKLELQNEQNKRPAGDK